MALSLRQRKTVWAAARRVQSRERSRLRGEVSAARKRPVKAKKKTRRVRASQRLAARAGSLDDNDSTIDADELIRFAKAYRDLGEAVAEQLDDLFEGERGWEDVNPNAVDLISMELGGFSDEIDEVINDYENWRDEMEGIEADEDEPPEMISSRQRRRRR